MKSNTASRAPTQDRRIAIAVVALAVTLAACGASANPRAPSSATAAPTTAPGGPATSSGAPTTSGIPIQPGGLPGTAAAAGGPFPGGLLIADGGNGRLLVVSSTGQQLWQFPTTGSLPSGQAFEADDAFIAPDGRTIVANDDSHDVIDRIDIGTGKVIWQYGHYGVPGRAAGYLNGPDDSYPLANGDVVVADIKNCRVIEIAPSKQIVQQWGQTGRCIDLAPRTYGSPNGDTPLPDGGLLITNIHGSRVVRLSATGKVIFDIHVPVAYPSDAHLDAKGNVIVTDYSTIGAVVLVSPQGRLLWRYAPTSGNGRLDHPSLAAPLPNGMIVVNDDFRARVVVIDPTTNTIVWQYGRTGAPGNGPGQLSVPDGVDVLPVGIF
jgi:outer membrane protein assembly factor BamB